MLGLREVYVDRLFGRVEGARYKRAVLLINGGDRELIMIIKHEERSAENHMYLGYEEIRI